MPGAEISTEIELMFYFRTVYRPDPRAVKPKAMQQPWFWS